MKAQGYTEEEEYWKDAIQGYTQELAIMNLRGAYGDHVFRSEAYELSLHESAEIEWKDDKLKARYELAFEVGECGRRIGARAVDSCFRRNDEKINAGMTV